MQTSSKTVKLGAAAALLLSTTALAMAQNAPAADANANAGMATQTTENPMVPVGDATHIAHLGMAGGDAAGNGMAWLRLDPQNNTLKWTIEYTGGGEITAASIMCAEADDMAAGAAGGANAGAAGGANAGAAGGADAGAAGGANAGAAGGADAGAAGGVNAGAAGGVNAGAAGGVNAGADAGAAGGANAGAAGGANAGAAGGANAVANAGAAAGMNAGANAGAMTDTRTGMGMSAEGMTEVVNLTERSTTMNSPLEGEAADLTPETFNAILAEACVVSIATSTDAEAHTTGQIVAMPEPAAGGM